MGAEHRKLSRFFQGNSFDLELDASGRVTLPAPLLDARGRSRRRSWWSGSATISRSGARSAGARSRSALDAEIEEVTERLGHPS